MQSSDPANEARMSRGPSAKTSHVLALLVLAGSLMLVFLFWRSASERDEQAARAEFSTRTDEASALLVQRLANYELIARGGVSLFASVARPSRRQWQNYVEGLHLPTRYPDLTGLGFIYYATSHQLAELQRMMRDSGEGLFSVWPHGVRDRYGPVVLLEPKSAENLTAMGYDLYADPLRRAVMDAARDSGQPMLSGRLRLVQDASGSGAPPGLLLLLPVYRAGDRPGSVAARRESMQGWVHTSFRVHQLVDSTAGRMANPVSLRIVDISRDGDQELYSSPGFLDGSAAEFRVAKILDVYGRRWRLEFTSQGQGPAMAARKSNLRTALAAGVLASFLLFGIALMLARTQSRAERLAAHMTESYRRSEMRFRSAMQYSAIGKALLDSHGRIVDANPALAGILGQSSEQLTGTAFDGHFIDDEDGVDASDRQQALLGEGVYRSTRTLLGAGGGLRQVQMTFAPVRGEIDEDIVRLVQVEDVTERLRAEAEVLALNRTLEARVEARTRELTIANQELESFAYSVSHDLRAPLRAIDGFSRLLDEQYGDAIDAQGHEYLARVRNAAGRMGSLIESLLKMARLGRSGIKPAAVDLSGLVREIVAELRADQPQRNVDVEVEPGLVANGDPTLVRNLLQNLVGNAWKFTSRRETARIVIGRDDAGAFFVRDNGAGFAPEYADKLFRPFQRLHTAEEFPGDGVGLASVRHIILRHGGTIRADAVLGQGATFTFTLPDAPSAQAS
ncbi:MAG: CHASE domain-containing protein [Luteimonas sp.]